MRRLGFFDVGDKLGEGGMGVVYRALDRRGGQEVALKVMNPDFRDDEERRARFLCEGRYTQAIDHPGVLTVHEIGEVHLEDGARTLYISLELAPRDDLMRRISRETPTQRWVVTISRRLAEALDAVHRHGLVHRDVKPGNVLLMSGDHPKLIDFGLASMSATPAGTTETTGTTGTTEKTVPGDLGAPLGASFKTAAGSVVGTPGYAAPEQLRGEPLDGRADLYSLGSTMFQMLTGGLPFAGDTASELLERVDAQGAEGVFRQLGERAPGVSVRLARLISALMEPDRERRPRDAATVAEALATLEADDEELDRPLVESPDETAITESAWMRLTHWWRA